MINTNYTNTIKPVFCIYNFLLAIKDDKYVLISKLDWIRVGNFIRGHWPKKDPKVFLLQADKKLTEYTDSE